MSGRRALIAGATGLVGGHCLAALLERPEYETVFSVGRRRVDLEHPKLEQLVVDFEKLPGLPPLDDVFCCLGTTMRAAGSREAFRRVDFSFVKALAQAGREAGALRFSLLSSVAADPDSSNFYLRVKGQIEQEIGFSDYEAVHIFRPSFLIGKREEPRLEERLGVPLARAFQFLLFGPMRLYRPIEARTVGRAMAGAALALEQGRVILHYDQIVRWADAVTATAAAT